MARSVAWEGAHAPVRLLAAVLLASCGGAIDEPGPATGGNSLDNQPGEEALVFPGEDFEAGLHPHVMPLGRGPTSAAPTAAAIHLSYFGGRVISNVRVVEVLWGAGTYISQISGTQMNGFYTGVTNSPYFDWLTEYNTTIRAVGGQVGTNQQIGRGTFGGKFTITPTTTAKTLADSRIQLEISRQITAGHLPAPTSDARGNVNTIYMVHFPRGFVITLGTSRSCQAGGFCAYHGTLSRAGKHLYYGVLPNMSAGSGCDLGCGAGSIFQNQTSVASHELIEAVTDPEVGLATVFGPPLAWYDPVHAEIGDICNGIHGTIVGGNGITYTVQKEWSNRSNICKVR